MVALDQITKVIAKARLQDGAIIRLFDGDLVWLLYVDNPGMAFGLRIIPTWVLAIISLAAAVTLAVYLFRHRELPSRMGVAMSMIVAGALGNMIDRFFRGSVIDFISVEWPDWLFGMQRFPVFNVADSAVSVGVTIVLLINLFTTELASPPDKVPLPNTSSEHQDDVSD